MIQIVVRIKNSIQKTKIKDVIPNLGGAYFFFENNKTIFTYTYGAI